MKKILLLIGIFFLISCNTIDWKYEKGDIVYLKDDSAPAIITTKWFGPKYHMLLPDKDYEHITLPETAIYGKKSDKIIYPKSAKMIDVTIIFKEDSIVKKYDSIIVLYPDTVIFYKEGKIQPKLDIK